MDFQFESRDFDFPLINTVWRTYTNGGEFISQASTNWELVITRQADETQLSIHGPETRATVSPVPDQANIMGINFALGAFMPQLPVDTLRDKTIILPKTRNNTFWLNDTAWEIPTFDNVDVFIKHLIKQEILVIDPIVLQAIEEEPSDVSLRTVQRRFVTATGITQNTLAQIERARHALTLLQRGNAILDVVYMAGYADQPHLTRALKRFVGRTPAQILQDTTT